jgi:hypothetical protein
MYRGENGDVGERCRCCGGGGEVDGSDMKGRRNGDSDDEGEKNMMRLWSHTQRWAALPSMAKKWEKSAKWAKTGNSDALGARATGVWTGRNGASVLCVVVV